MCFGVCSILWKVGFLFAFSLGILFLPIFMSLPTKESVFHFISIARTTVVSHVRFITCQSFLISGLTVNAKVVANKAGLDTNTTNSDDGDIKTFLGEIYIKRWRFTVNITPSKITLMGETIDWTNGMCT